MTAGLKQHRGMRGHFQTYICPLRGINNLLWGNCHSSVTSYYSLNIFWCHFVTLQKDYIKLSLKEYLYSDRWRARVYVWRICVLGRWQEKAAEGRDGVFQEERSVKIPLGEKTHMPLCAVDVLRLGFNTELHERDWCSSQPGQCAVWPSVSGWMASAHQLHYYITICAPTVCRLNDEFVTFTETKCPHMSRLWASHTLITRRVSSASFRATATAGRIYQTLVAQQQMGD